MTEFCDQAKVLDFLSDSGVWVMSYEFWVWVMKTEYWVMKIETPLNQMEPYYQKLGNISSNTKKSHCII